LFSCQAGGQVLFYVLMNRAVFYRSYRGHPYFNMAFDEWLFARAYKEAGAVYLRLYSWYPGGITFGRNQRKELALELTKIGSTPVIRRITGGRAIYHDPSEITYSIVANTETLYNSVFGGTWHESFDKIAEALTIFLKKLGITSEYIRRSSPVSNRFDFFHKAPCFASVARHEIVTGKKKIVASAQRRVGTTFLQHGSIKLQRIVSHPALSFDNSRGSDGESPYLLSENEFSRFSEIFRDEMGKNLNLQIEECDLNEVDKKLVIERVEKLKKKSLVKRDIF